MRLSRRQVLHLAAGTAAFPAVSNIAKAQAYPVRPITIVVPFAAGGGFDAVVRTIAQRMRDSLGQTVIIENVTGANGTIGVGRVARAAGDGYTLIGGGWATFVANGAVYNLPYSLLNDFAPIALVATQPLLIVAKNVVPAKDLKGFVAWLRDNPDKVSAGTSGIGSIQHIGGIYFQSKTGTRFTFVPYRGGAPTLQDLVAGQIDLIISPAADCVEQVRAGRIKAFAVMAQGRLAAAPGVPTVGEAGFPELNFSQWYAFFAPKAQLQIAWPMRRYVNGSPISAKRFRRSSSKRQRHYGSFRRARSRNGGRSSRRLASGRNEPSTELHAYHLQP